MACAKRLYHHLGNSYKKNSTPLALNKNMFGLIAIQARCDMVSDIICGRNVYNYSENLNAGGII
jgi:hypothetical protein